VNETELVPYYKRNVLRFVKYHAYDMATELPSHQRAERRDKIRNRVRVLDAAGELFARSGVEGVTIDEIAAAAGVGVGTIYRGFVDKGGLVAAILDERERDLQDRLLSGAPPLGPGAPAGDRIHAFLAALCRLVESSHELLIVSENNTLGARYRIGSYGAWRLHLASLLREAFAEGGAAADPRAVGDPELLADALLAPLAADLYRHQRRVLGVTAKWIRETVTHVADGVVGGMT
jgi:AcrR family transcriptional regulator